MKQKKKGNQTTVQRTKKRVTQAIQDKLAEQIKNKYTEKYTQVRQIKWQDRGGNRPQKNNKSTWLGKGDRLDWGRNRKGQRQARESMRLK